MDLGPENFSPPPKVKSSVIRLQRNNVQNLECDENLFFKVVKQTFNQRRKMIRNTIKSFGVDENFKSDYLTQRPEQLSGADFIVLTQEIEMNLNSNKR
jgi:16S rRNA (adenine1518-N6/adenine1519-N6)-dimethyltransferase